MTIRSSSFFKGENKKGLIKKMNNDKLSYVLFPFLFFYASVHLKMISFMLKRKENQKIYLLKFGYNILKLG